MRRERSCEDVKEDQLDCSQSTANNYVKEQEIQKCASVSFDSCEVVKEDRLELDCSQNTADDNSEVVKEDRLDCPQNTADDYMKEQEIQKGASVSFGSVEIHLFPTIVGDNPSVGLGAPLSMDWEQINLSKTSVELFEQRPRRQLQALRMSANQRHRKLRRLGYTDAQIEEASESANRTRKERMETSAQHRYGGLSLYADEVKESIITWAQGLITTSIEECIHKIY